MSDHDLDLGSGVTLTWTQWSPDRTIESNRARYEGVPDVARIGFIIEHPNGQMPGGRCQGFCYVDTPEVARIIADDRHRWQVLSWEPLTLSPSILCRGRNPDGTECGFHGWIRGGKWVPA